jgi:integrase
VLRRLFAWAREARIIPSNPALELRTGWGGSLRRKVIIPSVPQVLRLARALDHFKAGLGDVAIVLAFTGLRWEEAVAVLIGNVNMESQCMTIERTASESGGRRDVREDMKTRAAVRPRRPGRSSGGGLILADKVADPRRLGLRGLPRAVRGMPRSRSKTAPGPSSTRARRWPLGL